MIVLLLACAGPDLDTATAEGNDTAADTAEPGEAPVIGTLDVLWQEFGDEGVVMYADATVTDAEGDLVGGVAKFDVATGSGQPVGFEVGIEACADVSGACWQDPHLILAIPDVITANDYSVELWVIDAAGHSSASATGFLEGGG